VLRTLPCRAADAQSLQEWQTAARTTLADLLHLDDQIAGHGLDATGQSSVPLNAVVLETTAGNGYTRRVIEIDARPDRRIKVVVTVPAKAAPRGTPAVVCIHGHGGNRNIVYDPASPYRGFATILAEKGYVTLSTDVGQHEVQDRQRTLMGERLWDLMRVVDLAVSQPEVDARRMGCAGLSLGGEMAMWLGAMDTRMRATVSSGFLTTMSNLRHGHCPCWDFPGLQQRYEFADIYSLISPRALQCQNGQLESLPGGFPVDLAQQAFAEIQRAYRAAERETAAELAVHPAGHVFDVAQGVAFLDTHLQ
jgi:dienelactone hydrolase